MSTHGRECPPDAFSYKGDDLVNGINRAAILEVRSCALHWRSRQILGATAGSRAMARSKLHVMGASVCVLLVLAMMAMEPANAAGVCNANALWPCFNSIQGARPPPPSKQCCDVVKNVDKICMCNQFKTASFPKQMLQNGLQLPKKCGRFDLRGFKCGVYTFPY